MMAVGIFRPWKICLLIFGLVLVCYWPTLTGEFIWNDSEYVTDPALRSLTGLRRIWTELGATEQYYPLLHSAFWVQHQLWGDHTLGYHLVTVVMHAGAALLFGLVLSRLAVPGACLAALLFALHPVHVESVAWITEQKNTLSLVFYLLAALAYLRFDETRRPGSYALALLLFLVSLLCKTVTTTLPAALLVVFWWKRGRLDWRRDALPLVPWLALGIAAGLLASWVEQHYVGAQGSEFILSGPEHVLVAGRAIWFYLGQLLWPFDLNFIYPRWQLDAASGWQWLFPLGVLIMTVVLWSLRQRMRSPLAVWLFFVGSLFPVLGVVNLYGARYSFVWDHWQYLPDLAPFALAAAGLTRLHERWRPQFRTVSLTLGLAMLAVLGTTSWKHSKIFRDNETLYRQTLARNPSCWLAYNNLAFLLAKDLSRVPEAIGQYEKALSVKPDYAEAHMNLAGLLVTLPGGIPEALTHYELALQLKPDFVQARLNMANELAKISGRESDALANYAQVLQLKPDYADAHYNYAVELARLPGRLPEAIEHYQQALRFKPDLAEAHGNLASILVSLPGRLPEALAHFQEALKISPNSAEVHYNLANTLADLPGREPEAITHYERALLNRPDFAEAHVNLANLQARIPARQTEALAHYEQALRINPGLASAHYGLALLLSDLPGREADAQLNYEKALRLQADYPAAHNNLAILLARQGRLEEARKHWAQALALEPNFDEARRNLDLLDQLQKH